MNRELTQSFGGRTYSEGSHYLSSGDDITDNEEKTNNGCIIERMWGNVCRSY